MSKMTIPTLAFYCAAFANVQYVQAQATGSKTANNKQATAKTAIKQGLVSDKKATNSTASKPSNSAQSSATESAEATASLAAENLLRSKQTIANITRDLTPPYSPKIIDVTEQTISLGFGKKEELMFGFAAGDKIIFNFQEIDGKELKEIEIIEYPTLARFTAYKTATVKNKELIVNQQSVFIFRLKNASLAKRVCKLKIQRVPASLALEKFNPSVSWITKQDTIWTSYTTDVVIGYDTSYVDRTKRVLVRTEMEEQVVSDQIERVNTPQKIENRSSIVLSLPLNNRSAYRSTKVIGWAYWIGGGVDATRAWQQNLRSVRTNNMDYYTPLGAYANGGIAYLMLPKTGQQFNYFITDQDNRDLFMQKQPFRNIDQGKGFGGYKRFTKTDQCQGSFYICIENAGAAGYVDVHVKVTALIEKSYFEDRAYREQVVTPVTERQIKQVPNIRNTSLPVTGR
jgi:hypothetical protein